MKGKSVGSVASIWRYPVKSMAGEEMPSATVTVRGLLGDRAYAVVDTSSNRAASARTWAPTILSYRCVFLTEPNLGCAAPPVRITSPDGRVFTGGDPRTDEDLSHAFGRNVTLLTCAPAGLLIEFPAGTLGGAFRDDTAIPLGGAAPAGTFFDYACIHLIATSTLDALQTAYPKGLFDVRRFRPNIVVQSQAEPFVENTWIGREILIGNGVRIRVTDACPRCVNTTLAQFDLPHDSGILRTVVKQNVQDLGRFGKLPCVGAYARVVSGGVIRRHDEVCCRE